MHSKAEGLFNGVGMSTSSVFFHQLFFLFAGGKMLEDLFFFSFLSNTMNLKIKLCDEKFLFTIRAKIKGQEGI